MIAVKEFTASEITDYALKVLKLKGFVCWRSNNLAVKGRKFTGRKGVGDITGWQRLTGKRLECEVKKIGDTVKKEQTEFLTEASNDGCLVFLARQEGSEILIEKYTP
jgi:hypothetical protein